MSLIDHSDTADTVYDINNSLYWERSSLDRELHRVYDVCVGCRLCFNLCPSFPALFDAVDSQADSKRLVAAQEGRIGTAQQRTDFLDLPEGQQAAQASAEVEFVGLVTELSELEQWQVVDLCYQCRLCESICPYTPE